LGQAKVIDFEDIIEDTQPYLTEGFQFEATPLQSFSVKIRPTESLNGSSSSNTSVFPNFGFDDHGIQITLANGSSFSLIGFDLLEPNSLGTFPGPGECRVSGVKSDGSIIEKVIEVDGVLGSQTYNFKVFHDLISVSILSAGEYSNFALDNVIVAESALVYPQLALGGGYEVVLFMNNRSSDPWSGVVWLNGGAWSKKIQWTLDGSDQTGKTSFQVMLQPHETRKFILAREGNLAIGWLDITPSTTSSLADLSTSYFYNYFSGKILADSTGVAPSRLTKAVRFPVEFNSKVNTGFAVKHSIEPVQFTLYDQSGSMLQQTTIAFNQASFVNELFFGVSSDLVGSVEVYSPTGLSIVVIRLESIPGGGFQLTSIPGLVVDP
jgi:hypothetical protein